MKYLHYVLFVSLFSVAAVSAQNAGPAATSSAKASAADGAGAGAKRGPVFRATKDQIVAAQTMLKTKGMYGGEASGKLDPDTRASIKTYQEANGLRATGALNRATLEKMGLELTESQKAIPVSENSYAKASSASRGDGDKPRRAVFRATKDQVIEAQKILRNGGLYAGEETGKLDDTTRDGLKRYQESKGLKVTGTLNQVTLQKMGIALTDKQKGDGGTH
jgi:peptidoglycan hydrolase-like protein with peptidoglycan-binding domain